MSVVALNRVSWLEHHLDLYTASSTAKLLHAAFLLFETGTSSVSPQT